MSSQHWPSAQSAKFSDSALLDIEQSCNTVFVRNLGFDVVDEQLAKYFEDVGPVKRAFTVKDKHTDISRGYGFVEFSFANDAKFAVTKFNGKLWYDRELKVELALQQSKDPVQRQKEKEKLINDKRKQQAELNKAKSVEAKIDYESKRKEKMQREENEYKQSIKKARLDLSAAPNATSLLDEKKPIKVEKDEDFDEMGCVLLITGLDSSCDEFELKQKCGKYGTIKSIIYPSPESLPPTPQAPAGLAARITFSAFREAKLCSDSLAQRHFGANRVKPVIRVLSSQAAIKIARLIVRNLSFKTTPDDLKKLFSPYGQVLDVHFPKSVTGHMRGFGFVQMDSFENATQCVNQLNGSTLNGRSMTVDFTIPKSQFDTLSALKPKIQLPSSAKEERGPESESEDESMIKSEEMDSNTLVQLGDATDDKHFEQEFTQGDIDDDEDVNVESELVYNNDEDEDDDVESSEDDEEAEIVPKSKKTQDVTEGRTIFIRNLSYDTDEEALYSKFSEFGKLMLVKICRDSVLNRSLGTAFIKFHERAVVDDLLKNHAGEKKDSKDKYKKHAKQPTTASLLNQSSIRVDGRDLILSLAVDRNQAKELTAASQKSKDKRNLYLAKEGVIMPDTEASEGVSKADMEKRTRGWQEKKQKLRNPNFAVSQTRLSVRNIPLQLTDKELRQLCYNTVKTALKNQGKKVGDIAVKQVRIERESKKIDKDGLPRSRGFGFVEFRTHEHSLLCLRCLNNNPEIWGQHKRPMVEFALEDARKLLIHHKRKLATVNKNEKTQKAKINAEAEALAVLSGAKVATTNNTKELQDIFKTKGQIQKTNTAQKRGRATDVQSDKKNIKKQKQKQ